MIILAYGLPGTGKSTLLHDLVALHAKTKQWRFFCMDHELGWVPEGLHWRGVPPEDLKVIDSPDDFEELQTMPRELMPRHGVWVFNSYFFDADTVASLALKLGNVCYVDDEIDVAMSREGWDKKALRRIAHQGRHIINDEGEVTHCHIMGAGRRPQNMHTDIASMIDSVYVLRIQGDRTIERLVNDSIIGKADVPTIISMPDFKCYNWPTRKYFDIPPVGTPRAQQHQPHEGAMREAKPDTEE